MTGVRYGVNGDVTRADVVRVLRNFGRSYDLPTPSSAAAPAAVVADNSITRFYMPGAEQHAVKLPANRSALEKKHDKPANIRLFKAAVDNALADLPFGRSLRRAEGLSFRASRGPVTAVSTE